MTSDDAPRFASTYASLRSATRASSRQQQDLDRSETMELYFEALKAYAIGHVEAAAFALSQRSSFFPTVAEWRGACQGEAARASADAPLSVSVDRTVAPGDVAAIEAARAGLAEALDTIGQTRAAAALITQPLRVPRPDYCEVCRDTGWLTASCQAGSRCGRPSCATIDAPTHEFVQRCECRDSNPIFQRRMQAMSRRLASS